MHIFAAMTQVVQHDYGKSRVTLRQIRAAIKAVNAGKSKSGEGAPKPVAGENRKAAIPRSTKRSRQA